MKKIAPKAFYICLSIAFIAITGFNTYRWFVTYANTNLKPADTFPLDPVSIALTEDVIEHGDMEYNKDSGFISPCLYEEYLYYVADKSKNELNPSYWLCRKKLDTGTTEVLDKMHTDNIELCFTCILDNELYYWKNEHQKEDDKVKAYYVLYKKNLATMKDSRILMADVPNNKREDGYLYGDVQKIYYENGQFYFVIERWKLDDYNESTGMYSLNKDATPEEVITDIYGCSKDYI